MQALYQLDVQGSDLLAQLEQFFVENSRDESARRLARQWTKKAWEKVRECDKLIAEASTKWKLPRLSAVDKNILRLSVYQLKFCADIPPSVVINEAIELAKKFSGEQSPAFVNGVLDAVLKKIKTQNLNSSAI
jgi:N utilization substance protein B